MPRGRARVKQENKENDSAFANEEQTSENQVQQREESVQITDKMQKISLTDDKRSVKFATKKKTKENDIEPAERKRKNQRVKIASKKTQQNDEQASEDEVVAKVHIYDTEDAPACNIYDVASDSQPQQDHLRIRPRMKRVDIVQQPLDVTSSPVKQAFALFDWGEEKIKETLDTKKLKSQELNSILEERNLSTEGTRQQKIQRLEEYLVAHEGYQPSPKKETAKLNIQINYEEEENTTSLIGFGFRSTDSISDVPLERKPIVKATYSRRSAAAPAKPEPKPVSKQAPAAKSISQRKKK